VRLICFALLTISMSIALVGCRGNARAIPELTPVTGVAKIKGKPLSDAEIVFLPVESTVGAGASGKTDANGNFTLTYAHGGTGAPAGKYKVIAKKEKAPKGAPASPDLSVPGIETLPTSISAPELSKTYVTVAKGGAKVEVDFK